MLYTIGIVADDWKVEHFEKALKLHGFFYEKFPFTRSKDCITIRVKSAQHRLGELKKLIEDVQLACRKLKAKEN